MKTYTFTIEGKKYEVEIASVEGKSAKVSVNGKEYDVTLGEEAPAQEISAPVVVEAAPAPAASAPAGKESPVPSPMQGTVVEVKVSEGQAVRSGDTVIVIESMKMEVEISATADGVVKSILVQKGDQLEEGQNVVIIA
ncbi:MAG: biotin/lipoyl-binding protein [Bacteroidales bacterium]|nr:biotin/lipoyl-binding protein [Bacteroidales bacterium]